MGIAPRLADLASTALRFAALTAFVLAALGDRALADPKVERADALFAEGKALLESNLLQACARFEESLQYNPAAIGTLLNVALCDEKLGRIASAVAKFSEARDRAKEQGLAQHVRAADQHISALEPDLPHLSLKLSEPLPDTTILIDDRVIAPGALADVVVDPGERVIVVSAPARLPYRAKLIVHRAAHLDVVIPALSASVTITSSRRRIGQITALVGAAAAGTGVGLGLYARNLYHSQFGHQQPGDGLCDVRGCERKGQLQIQRARTLGNVGTAIGFSGAVVAAIGAFLWFGASDDTTDHKLTLAPQLGPDQLGLAALGSF